MVNNEGFPPVSSFANSALTAPRFHQSLLIFNEYVRLKNIWFSNNYNGINGIRLPNKKTAVDKTDKCTLMKYLLNRMNSAFPKFRHVPSKRPLLVKVIHIKKLKCIGINVSKINLFSGTAHILNMWSSLMDPNPSFQSKFSLIN